MQFCLTLLLAVSSVVAAPIPEPGLFSSLFGGVAKSAVKTGTTKAATTTAAKGFGNAKPSMFGNLFKAKTSTTAAQALKPLTGMSTKGKLAVAGVAAVAIGGVTAGGMAIQSSSNAKAAAEAAPVAQAPAPVAPVDPNFVSAFNQVRVL